MKTAKKYTILFIVAVSLMVTGLSSCLNDLDTIPLDRRSWYRKWYSAVK